VSLVERELRPGNAWRKCQTHTDNEREQKEDETGVGREVFSNDAYHLLFCFVGDVCESHGKPDDSHAENIRLADQTGSQGFGLLVIAAGRCGVRLRRRILGCKRQAQQILNQIALFGRSQTEVHASVVVVHDVVQRCEAAIVIKATFEVCEEVTNRRSAVALIRCAVGLETVCADFRNGVQIPASIGPEWFDVAVVAFGFAAEQRITAVCRRGIEAAGGGWGGGIASW